MKKGIFTKKQMMTVLLAIVLILQTITPIFAMSTDDSFEGVNELSVENVMIEESEEGSEYNPDNIDDSVDVRALGEIFLDDASENMYLYKNSSYVRLIPSSVNLTKVAEKVDDKLNTFKITLRLEATSEERSNDIVLVIDRSGSMKDGGRMDSAKKAATQFVEQLLDSAHPNTRISLVSFAGDATENSGFVNFEHKSELLAAIDRLSPGGATHTQAGLRVAKERIRSSHADFKNVVLLSDGEPTFAYAIDNPDNYLNMQYIEEATPRRLLFYNTHNVYGDRMATTADVPEKHFNYNETVGGGYAMFHRYFNQRLHYKRIEKRSVSQTKIS